jgi:hypothetical protein
MDGMQIPAALQRPPKSRRNLEAAKTKCSAAPGNPAEKIPSENAERISTDSGAESAVERD